MLGHPVDVRPAGGAAYAAGIDRACEDRRPELFAAFMMAAGTAIEGRNAVNAAPSLPLDTSGAPRCKPLLSLATDVADVADELADLAGILARLFFDAAATAILAGDRAACHEAARAGAEIHRLLARDGDETRSR